MTVPSLITGGRTLVENTFIDEGTITRESDAPRSIDDITLTSTPFPPAVIYSGRCRVKKPTQVEAEEIFGDTQVTVQRRLINLPYDAPEIRVDDVFTATSSIDPELLRQTMRVVAVVATSTQMFRQLGAEVVE